MAFTMTAGRMVREFKNRAEALRWLSRNMQFGSRPGVEQLYMPTEKRFPADKVEGGWHAWHFDYRSEMTFEEYRQLAVVQQRYQRYHHWVTEVDAQWRNDGPAHYWADNSIEQPQINRHGQTRTVMVAAPSGDACF